MAPEGDRRPCCTAGEAGAAAGRGGEARGAPTGVRRRRAGLLGGARGGRGGAAPRGAARHRSPGGASLPPSLSLFSRRPSPPRRRALRKPPSPAPTQSPSLPPFPACVRTGGARRGAPPPAAPRRVPRGLRGRHISSGGLQGGVHHAHLCPHRPRQTRGAHPANEPSAPGAPGAPGYTQRTRCTRRTRAHPTHPTPRAYQL